MESSLDALEALLQFRRGRAAPQSLSSQPLPPVPNPLDPAQPHFIEGDAPTCVSRRPAFCGEALASAVAVPDPLAKPAAPRLPAHDRESSSPNSASATSNVRSPANPLGEEVQRRGKRRRRQNDAERLELTRHRNRAYAKSTRLKKKKRLQALLETEAKYLRLQEKQALEQRRTDSLVHCVKNLDNASKELEVKQLAGQDSVFLGNNTGMIKILARELQGVICANFVPGTADISAVSLYWSSPKSISSLAGTSPLASVLSLKA